MHVDPIVTEGDTARSPTLIQLRDVSKSYSRPAGLPFSALTNVSLNVEAGERVAVTGKSGSGKSTLLNLLCGLDQPTTGQVFVDGHAIHTLSERSLALWRGRTVGVVFQFFQLLPTLTVAENVMLPMDLCNRWPSRARPDRAHALLQEVGIADQANKLPGALSGGQQQRAAIARALANDPSLILADEPTGNLDSVTTEAILALFSRLASRGKTVIVVTHDPDVARQFGRTLQLADGAVVSDETRVRWPSTEASEVSHG